MTSMRTHGTPRVDDLIVARYLGIDLQDETSNGNGLLCRLCGMKNESEETVHIFRDTTDLAQKINTLIPITISQEDTFSNSICSTCYEKVNFIHDFILICVENDKKFSEIANLEGVSHAETKSSVKIEGSSPKRRNKREYECPNCTVGLMIIKEGKPQPYEDSLQISLVRVDRFKQSEAGKEKSGYVSEEEIIENKGPSAKKASSIKKSADAAAANENAIRVKTRSQINKGLLAMSSLKLEYIDDEHSNDESLQNDEYSREQAGVDGSNNRKRKSSPDDVHDAFPGTFKSRKVDTDASEDLLHSVKSDQVIGEFLKFETLSVDTAISDNDLGPTDGETASNACQFEDVETEDNGVQSSRKGSGKAAPKKTCALCGARYVSPMKYEFHMVRHQFGDMDKYSCPQCGRVMTNENSLWDHYYYMHKRTKRYACATCGKLYHKLSKLKVHQEIHNSHKGTKEVHVETDDNGIIIDNPATKRAIAEEVMTPVNCVLCGETVPGVDPDGINDAVTCANCEGTGLSLKVESDGPTVITRRQFHCSICPKHFAVKERLEFHEMRHGENMDEFVCSSCGKELSAENALYEHYMFVHKGARPHVCDVCGKSFQLKARLKEHFRSHTGERPFECDVCGQRSMTKNALKLHQKTHMAEKRHPCLVCSKAFRKKQYLNEHLERHWKNDKSIVPEVFACPVCPEKFPTFRTLRKHLVEMHGVDNQDPLLTEQKPWYECDECDRKFKHQMSLKVHREKTHEGRVTPVYCCDNCDASYRTKQLLINHMNNKHGGEKRYKCALCGKDFGETKSLHYHILHHTGEKPFHCGYCEMTFRRKDSRDQHQRRHTGERHYKCQDCGERFATTKQRIRHRKREHSNLECYECPECGKKCIGQHETRMHLNMHLGQKLKLLQEHAA